MTVAVEIRGLEVRSPNGPVLEVEQLEVTAGEGLALVGPSGGGKTTLLRALLGHVALGLDLRVDHAQVCGCAPFELDAPGLRRFRRERVAFVPQDPASRLNPRHTVRTLLAEVAPPERRTTEALRTLLQEVHLPDVLDRRPSQLSGGEIRRVAIARALARTPQLLLLDEPTAGLDPHTATALMHTVAEAAARHGSTIVLATHHLTRTEGVVSRAVEVRRRVAPHRQRARREVPPTASAERVGLPVLACSDVHVRAGGNTVVAGADLTVHAGEAVAVVGPSGAGKTSLLRCLAGIGNGSGEIAFLGVPLALSYRNRSPDQLQRIQYVAQDPVSTLHPRRTVGRTLARPLRRICGLSRADVRDRAVELLTRVDLPSKIADRRPEELSGGQRQRVAIARALAFDPQLMLCDEVTSALDAATAEGVMRLLDRLRDERGLAVLFVTHDLALAARHASRTVLIRDGSLSADYTELSLPTPFSFMS